MSLALEQPDESIEDAICDSQAIRGFVGIALHREPAPDATPLKNQGSESGRFRVRNLMRKASVKPVWKRTFIHATDCSGQVISDTQ